MTSRRVRWMPLPALFFISVLLLFAGFYCNLWRVVDSSWFNRFQRMPESLTIGRMVQSEREGIFSYAGLPGQVSVLSEPPEEFDNGDSQYDTYRNGGEFHSFHIYRSRPGAEGMLFGLLDSIVPASPAVKLKIFYVIISTLTAALLAAFVCWLHGQFGWCVSLTVLATTILSPWLTLFGRNLWWGAWVCYIPPAVALFVLWRERLSGERGFFYHALWACGALFVKCLLNGYEFITVVLVMMTVPYVYHAVLDGWGIRRLAGRFAALSAGSLIGILASMVLLATQISSATGENGFRYILYAFGKRSYGAAADYPEIYAGGLGANPFSVIFTYMKIPWLSVNHIVYTGSEWVSSYVNEVRFGYLVVLFLVVTLFLARRKSGSSRRAKALIVTTWFSLLAPLSWLVVFKAHSFVHTHVDPVIWHMPFTLFGFALCGLLIKEWIAPVRGPD